MYFTQHAIDDFRRRCAPGFGHARALRELVALARSAVLLRDRTKAGDLQYRVTDGAPIILVCKRERGRGGDGLVCVTIWRGEDPTDLAS